MGFHKGRDTFTIVAILLESVTLKQTSIASFNRRPRGKDTRWLAWQVSPRTTQLPLEVDLRTRYSGDMLNPSRKRRDRYDTSGNPETEYMDAQRTVLANIRGITDLEGLQLAEEESLAVAYETVLGEVRTGTPLTCEFLQHIHGRIFGDLYAWAGQWRTVWLSKPGITWPAPDFLERNMAEYEVNVLRRHPPISLSDDNAFCSAVGEIQGEFLVVHPFREGNARTIKLATDILALQTGRPLLLYDSSTAGQAAYIAAAKAAFSRHYDLMAEIIRNALERSRQAR